MDPVIPTWDSKKIMCVVHRALGLKMGSKNILYIRKQLNVYE